MENKASRQKAISLGDFFNKSEGTAPIRGYQCKISCQLIAIPPRYSRLKSTTTFFGWLFFRNVGCFVLEKTALHCIVTL